MAFNMKEALLRKQEELEDDFTVPQENKHLFDDFIFQYNYACKLLNKCEKDCITLKYYLMNEILLLEVLEDCHIPVIEPELCSRTDYFFDPELSFYAEKGYRYKISLERTELFKYLIQEKGLSYYKSRKTTLDDLKKIYFYDDQFSSFI